MAALFDRTGRALLKMALVIAPFMIAGYVVGLPYGPKGVAFAYSAVMMLWIVPLIACAVHGTVFSFWDILRAVSRPLASSIVAGALAFAVRLSLRPIVVSFTQATAGKYCSSRRVPWDAHIRHGTEIILLGSPSRIKSTFIG